MTITVPKSKKVIYYQFVNDFLTIIFGSVFAEMTVSSATSMKKLRNRVDLKCSPVL